MTINTDYLADFLVGLPNTPIPTGDAARGIACVEMALRAPGLETRRVAEGALVATLDGQSDTEPRALMPQVDTLDAMVKEVKGKWAFCGRRADQK